MNSRLKNFEFILRALGIPWEDLSSNDKLVKIVTLEKGLISAIARNSKTIKNRLGGMVQLFSYGKFTLYPGKNGYIVNDIEIVWRDGIDNTIEEGVNDKGVEEVE